MLSKVFQSGCVHICQWRAHASRLGALDLGPVDRETSAAEVVPSLASLWLELLPRLAHPELVPHSAAVGLCSLPGGGSEFIGGRIQ